MAMILIVFLTEMLVILMGKGLYFIDAHRSHIFTIFYHQTFFAFQLFKIFISSLQTPCSFDMHPSYIKLAFVEWIIFSFVG